MSAGIVPVRVSRLPHALDLPLPSYETEGAAGMDLRAAIAEPVTIVPGSWELIPVGIAIALPPDHEAQVRPRSGLAMRYGITVINAPGTIDSDYRGEIKVPLINHGREAFTLERGHRIAQLIVAPVSRVAWQETDALGGSARGQSGFGSTGR